MNKSHPLVLNLLAGFLFFACAPAAPPLDANTDTASEASDTMLADEEGGTPDVVFSGDSAAEAALDASVDATTTEAMVPSTETIMACGSTVRAWTRLLPPVSPRGMGSSTWTPPRMYTGAMIESLSISPQNTTGQCGTPVNFTAMGRTGAGSTSDLTNDVRWTSDNPAVASAIQGSEGGRFSMESSGSATITAQLGTVTARTTVTANCDQFIQLSVETPTTPARVCARTQLYVNGVFADGTTRMHLSAPLLWGTSDGSIAVITETGELLGLRAGTVQITAGFSYLRSAPLSVTIGP